MASTCLPLERLKQLRHPGILRYVASSCEAGQTVLVTERVRPLEGIIEELEPVEILAGLNDVLEALVFLHDRKEEGIEAGVCHNNLSPSSVFVAGEGGWRLGGLECASEAAESRHWIASDFAKTVKQPPFVPPEDQDLMKKGDFPVHARDAYAFGQLVAYAREHMTGKISEDREEALSELVSETSRENGCLRPQLAVFIHSGVFENELSLIAAFLDKFPAHEPAAADEFFQGLCERLTSLPGDILCRRLGKGLLSRYVFLSPAARLHFLPRFLSPKRDPPVDGEDGLIPEAVFSRYLSPELGRAFCVHEVALRLALLQHLPAFVHSFSDNVLEKVLLPELLLGMKDENEEIVAGSLRGLASLVPLLGAPLVTGLQHRKYFHEGRPKKAVELAAKETKQILKSVKAALNPADKQKSPGPEEEAKRAARAAKAEERRRELETRKAERRERLAAAKAEKAAAALLRPPSPEESTQVPTPPPEEEDEAEESWEGWEEGEEEADEEDGLSRTHPVPPDDEPLPPHAPLSPAPSQQFPSNPDELRAILAARTRQLEAQTRQELGAEFEINAIQVEVKESEEEDLFADMAPRIVRKPASEAPRHQSSSMFDVASADGNAESGWGDEEWD